MKLDKKLVDLDFLPNSDLIYTGYCLKENRQILVLINFDDRTKCFDGLTVFRSKEITKYRLWSKDEIKKIKKDNRKDIASLVELNNMKTFYSCLKSLDKDDLVAFFTERKTKEYYVGKIIRLTRDSVKLKLVDPASKWIGNKTLNLKDINYFSFLSKYETKLQRNVT